MRTFLLSSLLLFLIPVVSFAQKGQSGKKKASYVLLTPTDFQKKLNAESGILLDVRTPNEFRKGTISGSRNLDLFNDRFEIELEKLDRSKTYYVFCAVGGRSAEAVELMKKKGFQHIVELDGGFNRWMSQGLPVSIP